jgi:hypothetical protein
MPLIVRYVDASATARLRWWVMTLDVDTRVLIATRIYLIIVLHF